MTNNKSDIQIMLEAEKAARHDPANRFAFTKQEITDVMLDFNFKNKRCDKVINGRGFKASQFVRFDDVNNAMVFKRDRDQEETVIKNTWVRNYDEVVRFIKEGR